MSVDENKQVMRLWFEEVYNKGNQEFAKEHLGPTYTMHRSDHGLEAPDIVGQGRVTLEIEAAEEDLVVSRVRFEGTVTGDWKLPWGTFTTRDKPMSFTWIAINRFEDGKIAEAWVEGDFLGIAMQVGAVPSAAR